MTGSRKMATIVAAMAVSALALCAGSAQAVVGGSPDNGEHPYVGVVEPEGSSSPLCSGSLVSEYVFVTAAHCFPKEGSSVKVSFESTVPSSPSDDSWHTGTVHLEDGFCVNCGNGLPGGDTHDLAVVVFDTAVSSVPVAQLPHIGAADALVNQRVEVVGYGIETFSPLTYGTREFATTKVRGGGTIGDEFLKLLAAPGACQGDSGGPDILPGTNTMVAITSFSNANPGCNGVSYSERLDRQDALDFINFWVGVAAKDSQ